MAERKILVWFRNDLRLHDNEMLIEAIAKSEKILPVYFFDPRHFGGTSYQTFKTGIIRVKFLIESVRDLRESFRKYNGDLLIMHGKPEEMLPSLVQAYGITEVYHHREVAAEETVVSSKAEDALWKVRVNLKHFIGHTLYNKEDLPFPIKDIPDNFARFKKKTEREATVKACFETPEVIHFVPVTAYGELPAPEELLPGANRVMSGDVSGGETASLNALTRLIEEAGRDESAKKTKKIYSKLSPWLTLGCLSPRKVYWKIKEAEQVNGANPAFNNIMAGLLWRDYFRFMFKKHGNHFFRLQGFAAEVPYKVVKKDALLKQWKAGETGNEVIDAIMQQLNATGNISNAARSLAALYLLQVLHLDWTLGAAYFEEKLIDYAPATNWGNWATLAGVGNEQPQKTALDFETQLKNFDPIDPLAIFAA